MSTENELKGQQALPVRMSPWAEMGGAWLYPTAILYLFPSLLNIT